MKNEIYKYLTQYKDIYDTQLYINNSLEEVSNTQNKKDLNSYFHLIKVGYTLEHDIGPMQ